MDNARAEQARRHLVEHLQNRGRLSSASVTRALETVPRHEFVPETVRDRAYEDQPLSIGHEQVVTAPHLVAQMTDLLKLRSGDTVLEIGTGSGYHAAVIAEIVGSENVFTIERFPDFAHSAQDALVRTGYGSVTVIIGDGSRGLPGSTPFDRIIVTAVAPEVPDPLLTQVADDGRLVLPLGPRDGPHKLVVVTKHGGRIDRTSHGNVRFVPLIGAHGFTSATNGIFG